MHIATLVFPRRGDKLHLAVKKRKVGAGFLNGYGGKLESEDDGDIDLAAIREFQQESRTRVWPGDLTKVGIIDFYRAGDHIFECHVYICHRWIGDLRETQEMGPPEVFDAEHPPLDRMMPGDRFWLEQIFSGEHIRAKVYYNADNTEVLDFHCEPLI